PSSPISSFSSLLQRMPPIALPAVTFAPARLSTRWKWAAFGSGKAQMSSRRLRQRTLPSSAGGLSFPPWHPVSVALPSGQRTATPSVPGTSLAARLWSRVHSSGIGIFDGEGDGLGLGLGRGRYGKGCPSRQALTAFAAWASRFFTSRSAFSSVTAWVVSPLSRSASLSCWDASYF